MFLGSVYFVSTLQIESCEIWNAIINHLQLLRANHDIPPQKKALMGFETQ